MKINIDFPLILTSLVLLTGSIALIDIVFFASKRKTAKKKQPWYIDYARSFFPVLLIVLLIRSFLIQPYRVPSGSLEPTILPGDFIVVNQFAYGLRLPVLNTKIWSIDEPKVGDIALFRWPKDPSTIFVKRVIGTPGDHIIYKNKELTINGYKLRQEAKGLDLDIENDIAIPVERRLEYLPEGRSHDIFLRQETNSYGDFDLIVPEKNYFMMGDNRDDSDDSRDWGFVAEENLIGKAFGIWMSWDAKDNNVRWKRIGMAIK